MLERVTRRDINGDGILGRRPDVVPGYPAVYGHPSMVYGPGGQVYSTNNFVAPNYQQQQQYHSHHSHHRYF
jgi:hypothetical protein